MQINYGTCSVCGWVGQNLDSKGRCPDCWPRKKWKSNIEAQHEILDNRTEEEWMADLKENGF